MKPITNSELNYYINQIYAEYSFLKEMNITYLTTLQNNEITLFVCNVPKGELCQRLFILSPRLNKPLDGYYSKPTALYPVELKSDTCKLLINDSALNMGDDTIILTDSTLNLAKHVAIIFKNRNIRIIDNNTSLEMLNQHIMRDLAKKGKLPYANQLNSN